MSQTITRQTVADKLAAYLRHDLSLADLVAWAEGAMMAGNSSLSMLPLFVMWWHVLVWPMSARSV